MFTIVTLKTLEDSEREAKKISGCLENEETVAENIGSKRREWEIVEHKKRKKRNDSVSGKS